MRVAVLNDIHGNLPALDAVLAEVRQERADRVVVGGDAVVGPMTRETLDRLLALDVPVDFIVGNCEVAVLDEMAGRTPRAVPEQYRPVIQWTAKQHRDQERLIERWPKTLRVKIAGPGDTLFCHGTPADENQIFTKMTAEDRLLPLFEPLGVDLVVCGHTHMQFDRTVGRTRVVNAGSVGMPFGEQGAYWLLLGPDVQLRRTMYDFAAAAERIRATSLPQVEDLAVRFVLNPPSEESMLTLYGSAELRVAP